MRGGWVERGTIPIRLSRPHFAFYRGYLDGLEVGALASHYLENSTGTENAADDLRIANSAIKWMRDQLLRQIIRSLALAGLTNWINSAGFGLEPGLASDS